MKIAIASLYANPLGVWHLNYLEAAKSMADSLFVIINNDKQVELKGSVPFYSQWERQRLVQSLQCVDNTIIAHDEDETVAATLSMIVAFTGAISEELNREKNEFIFCNGGDRSTGNPKELEICEQYNITPVYGVGGSIKTGSSSQSIEKAAWEFVKKNKWIVCQ
jgi:cytidyltransferase-like protein